MRSRGTQPTDEAGLTLYKPEFPQSPLLTCSVDNYFFALFPRNPAMTTTTPKSCHPGTKSTSRGLVELVCIKKPSTKANAARPTIRKEQINKMVDFLRSCLIFQETPNCARYGNIVHERNKPNPHPSFSVFPSSRNNKKAQVPSVASARRTALIRNERLVLDSSSKTLI